MFNVSEVKLITFDGYVCQHVASSKEEAKEIVYSYLASVREIDMRAELYCRGRIVFIASPDAKVTMMIAERLNKSIGK